jgi:hypothetical protein
MHLVNFEGKQYFYYEVNEINKNVIHEINTFFSRKCPYIFQADSFYKNGILCSVPDGQLNYLKTIIANWKKMFFEALLAFLLVDGDWIILFDDFYYYYDSNYQPHVMIKPTFGENKIELRKYVSMFYELMTSSRCDFSNYDSLINLLTFDEATFDEIIQWRDFLDMLYTSNSLTFDQLYNSLFFADIVGLYSDVLTSSVLTPSLEIVYETQNNIVRNIVDTSIFPIVLPLCEPKELRLTPSLFHDIECIVKYCIEEKTSLFFVFTAIDIIIRIYSSPNHDSTKQIGTKVLKLLYIYQNSDLSIKNHEDINEMFKLLNECDGIMICYTNPYYRYFYIDELLIFYIYCITVPSRYFVNNIDSSTFSISGELKENITADKFFKRTLPFPK